jgi:uncharacterized radical SAM protein YgiQ
VDLVQLRNPRDPKQKPQDHAPKFLPTTRAEMEARGWDELDVLLVTGDAYVDHPAFGPVLIARFLEGRGYRVGIVAQPRWDRPDDIERMGRPRLFVGISAGNLDSMLNKLTAQKKMRGEDQYSPDGKTDMRPNRATIVYSNLCRQVFPGLPVVLGGIEASLRRIAHYDYWSDQVRRSILLDAKADLLVFGMGERPAWEIARRLEGGQHVDQLTDIRGTAHVKRKRAKWEPLLAKASKFVTDGKLVVLPSYDDVLRDKKAFALMSRQFQYETNPHNGRPLLQVHGEEAVYFNSPAEPLSEKEMDGLYDLPFTRLPHPSYAGARIPAYETVKHSIVTMRGCFGGCTFCSITEHEGRIIQSRSEANVLREVRALSRMDDFRGTITDLGGPTANMYKMTCKDERTESACRRLSCVHPGVCENLVTDHGPLIDLMKKVRKEKGIKRVYIASGVRYDLAERSPEFIKELAELRQHVLQGERSGGQRAVPRPVLHHRAPGLDAEGHDRARALPEEERPSPPPGAGLHPHADGRRHDDVLHGPRPAHDEAGLHRDGSSREAPDEGAHLLVGRRELAAGARGAEQGGTERPDRARGPLPGAAGARVHAHGIGAGAGVENGAWALRAACAEALGGYSHCPAMHVVCVGPQARQALPLTPQYVVVVPAWH